MRKFKHKITGDIIKQNSSNFYLCEGAVSIPSKFIENGSDWEEIIEKDYEILSFIGVHGYFSTRRANGLFLNSLLLGDIGEYTEKDCINSSHWSIYSVKRLSDGEIFTIGDRYHILSDVFKTNRSYENLGLLIEKFEIDNNDIRINNNYLLSKISKVKTPLFTTVDGVEVFGNDTIYTVSDDFQLLITTCAGKEDKLVKSFAKKENAEKFILENKKNYSLNDMVRIVNHWKVVKSITPETALKVIKSW